MFLILKIIQTLRLFFIAPVARLFLSARMEFENRNSPALSSERRRCALFEVSSQGEWEQVKPLVLALLESGVYVDILYASASVEKEMTLAAAAHQGLRVRRLELLKSGERAQILKWTDPALVFFCRYDFYPELLLLGQDVPLILLNATLKNKDSWWQRMSSRLLLNHFHTIVWSSQIDCERAQELGLKASVKQLVGDLRPLAILARQSQARATLQARGLERLASYWEHDLKVPTLLIGSAWMSDLNFLMAAGGEKLKGQLLKRELQLWLAPHKLDAPSLAEFASALEAQLGVAPYLLKDDQFDPAQLTQACVVINALSRLLCESYVFFPRVMVGGGFERSAHSISEPFYAGALVGVGPKTHRSTEYEEALGLDAGRLYRFADARELELFLSAPLPKAPWPCQDRKEELLELRNHLCSLAMSTLPS